jgi:hypothetical protein
MPKRIIDRPVQFVTSGFGKRSLTSWPHGGIDLRTWLDDYSENLDIIIPEDCIFMGKNYNKKWGWILDFEPIESSNDYTMLRFEHVAPSIDFMHGHIVRGGTVIGNAMTTAYMKKKGFARHLHFETRKGKAFKKVDPLYYLHMNDIVFDFKYSQDKNKWLKKLIKL